MYEEYSEEQRQLDSTTPDTRMTSKTNRMPPVVESIQGDGDQDLSQGTAHDHEEEFGSG